MKASSLFVIEPLQKHHDRSVFSCGTEALDHYLRQLAGQDVRRNIASVLSLFGMTNPAAEAIGFYLKFGFMRCQDNDSYLYSSRKDIVRFCDG